MEFLDFLSYVNDLHSMTAGGLGGIFENLELDKWFKAITYLGG